VGGGVLGGQGVGGRVQVGLEGVVGGDDVQVELVHGVGQHGGLQLRELEILRVVRDVVGRGVEAGGRVHGDEALGLQQLQGAALVRHVVGHGDGTAVG